jgi:aerobic-type carbon monoxide dehydrogenase small subunit (CoxS/CutS family)
MSAHRLRFQLNGRSVDFTVPAERLLIELIRDDLGLSGTKEGCSVGVCGLCSVIVDGKLLSACLLPALFVDGAAVITIEGISDGGTLTPLQKAFIRHGGFQCGICTPGQIVAATALLAEHPEPAEDQVREWMLGNLCRCTGYYSILRSIREAAETGRESIHQAGDVAPVSR